MLYSGKITRSFMQLLATFTVPMLISRVAELKRDAALLTLIFNRFGFDNGEVVFYFRYLLSDNNCISQSPALSYRSFTHKHIKQVSLSLLLILSDGSRRVTLLSH
jgi:hypothetical protein